MSLCGAGIKLTGGSKADATNADISGALNAEAILVEEGSKITALGSDLRNAGTNALLCRDGSEANRIDAQASGHGTTNGIVALDGSIIKAKGTTAPTNLTVNEITSDGIIFR